MMFLAGTKTTLRSIFPSNDRKIGLQFGVGCGGGRFDALNRIGVPNGHDMTWNGEWSYAVVKSEGRWSAEIAIPLKTLAEAGLDINTLRMNAMSQNLSRQGQRLIFLAYPGYYGFGRCSVFIPIMDKAVELPERTFSLRLHFAEPKYGSPGWRIFDVVVQGRKVISNLDVVKATKGLFRPLVHEIPEVRASSSVIIDLRTSPGMEQPARPILSAIELTEK